ncbi:hypothetical protein MBLNU230_g2990t1 [Neophaeotheca triangularis]
MLTPVRNRPLEELMYAESHTLDDPDRDLTSIFSQHEENVNSPTHLYDKPPATMAQSRIAAMFEEQAAGNKADKSEMNAIVMNYLVTEGYPTAAAKFAQETNFTAPVDTESIEERVRVRDLIHTGKIDEAIELINEIDPAILDSHTALHFDLLQAQLVEIIRDILAKSSNPPVAAFQPVVDFATTQLAPRAPTDPYYQKSLEKTMALILYPEDKMLPELKELLDVKLRADIAKNVNRVLLESRGEESEARIDQLIEARVWSENQAREAGAPVPQTLPIGLEGGKEQNGDTNGEGDAMVQ